MKRSNTAPVAANEGHAVSIVHLSPDRVSHIDWPDVVPEGQLAVDVWETENELVVVAPMAGAIPDRIEVYARNDILTIRGERQLPCGKHNQPSHLVHGECFWGKFSRTMVLPVDVKSDLSSAEYRQGVLVVTLPKSRANTKIMVEVVEE